MTTRDHIETLREPHIQAETLTGLRTSGDSLRISLEKIAAMEAGKKDALNTVGLITEMVAIGAAVFVAAVAIAFDPSERSIWCD
jgi:hypothetical protein